MMRFILHYNNIWSESNIMLIGLQQGYRKRGRKEEKQLAAKENLLLQAQQEQIKKIMILLWLGMVLTLTLSPNIKINK